ncbi:aryl hydrocarbon receptor repressor isoform X2 [Oryctolagus cuniculus]|uniref:aryl hydrocarbon receptor repressor isoform X2 n=1 Tax=Oryctolagus cuniculus TaxID=9986 RepID=UPI003879F8D5
MIPPGDCVYAGRTRRRPIQKQRPALGAEKSNPSKRHRDRLNAELDHLASLLPLPPDVISKLDKLSVLRLSVSYLRVKSFFQAVQDRLSSPLATGTCAPGGGHLHGGSAVLEGRLLLESLDGFALVVSAEGMIFYASATIADYLGFHQTDVMHQNIYDYIHVDDRQDFCRQLHWAMDPPQAETGQPLAAEAGEDPVLGRLLGAQDGGRSAPAEFAAFLTRCFVCRVRCLLDSTSGFLTMQFQGKLKFLFGQKKKAPSGTALPPRLSLFCIVVPVLLPPVADMSTRSTFLRAKQRVDATAGVDTNATAAATLCDADSHGKRSPPAGRGSAESCTSLFRAQMDAGRWARVPARAPCMCLRSGPDFIFHPEGAAGDEEEEEQAGVLSSCAAVRGLREMRRYDCRLQTPGPVRHLSWTAGAHGEGGGSRLRPQPSRSQLGSVQAMPRGSCVPYPSVQGSGGARGTAAFRDSPASHLPSRCPDAYASRTSRPPRDVAQGPGPLPACRVPQGPPPAAQHFPAGSGSTEDTQGAPCHPLMSLEMPIKMEKDSGPEDAAGACSPGQVWQGASNVAKSHLVTFPTRVHLKVEPHSRPQVYAPHLGHRVLGAAPHSRAAAGPCRELAPFYPPPCACLEHLHSLPEPQRPLHLCTPGRPEHQPLGPGDAPTVKREPLDSPPWALIPPGASECTFLP